jgi:regulator of protease activity HflC (stomatin/prohibitin superfamily)
MGDFLLKAFEFLREFWPFQTIDADEQGVRFTLGKHVKLLQPGLHMYFPWLQKIEAWPVTYQEVDCLLQSIETIDGVSVSLSANVGYTVYNAAKMRLNVHNFDLSLERAARVHLFATITNTPFKEIKETLDDVAEECRKALHKQTSEWGVRIKRVGLTDFVTASAYRLFGGLNI